MVLSQTLFRYNHKPLTCPKINAKVHFAGHWTHLRTSYRTVIAPLFITNGSNPPLTTNFAPCKAISENDANIVNNKDEISDGASKGKSFWGAVGLIIGTAVGPGMLGLPALTIKSGPFPSTIIILASWLYVISSIMIVAELCFDFMEEDGVEEVAGNTLHEARKAILIGGAVPLVMVLSWNLIVLGLAGTNSRTPTTSGDPISLLLSVNPSALSAVQGFAFSALATSLIGYAVSLPKQLLDTLELVSGSAKVCNEHNNTNGRVGLAFYSVGSCIGNSGKVCFKGSRNENMVGIKTRSNEKTYDPVKVLITLSLLGFSVLIASFFRSTFSTALDFAGVYANCFLFGIIPPVMAYMQQSKKKIRQSIIPGGNGTLLLLFIISVVLGIWH